MLPRVCGWAVLAAKLFAASILPPVIQHPVCGLDSHKGGVLQHTLRLPSLPSVLSPMWLHHALAADSKHPSGGCSSCCSQDT